MQLNPLTLDSYGISDIGLVRPNNEDVWQALPLKNFFILADGIGGHKGGEVAAKIAVLSICESLEGAVDDVPLSLEDLSHSLQLAIAKANDQIYTLAEKEKNLSGMGTTLCCLLIHERTLLYAHVGDSRIYRFRKNKLDQLTQDHSLQREIPQKTDRDMPARPLYKNILTRALGTSPSVQPDLARSSILADDLYFLCSDGLTDLLSLEEISHLLQDTASLKKTGDALVEAAKIKGGHDNITIVIIKILS